MKKYIILFLLYIQPIMTMNIEKEDYVLIQRHKKRECVSRMLIESHKNKDNTLTKSQSIPIAGSGEFAEEEPKSAIAIFKLSRSSLSEQGCSPNFRDFYLT